jgi:S-adenosylmethionine-dependent methyltransferase
VSARQRRSARTAVVWDALATAVRDLSAASGSAPLEVVDVGGGTGGFAVPLAELGHRVTVVDPNPNALATLDRRAADAHVEDLVRAVQGEAAGLADVVGYGSSDIVLCHRVLEVADDPVAAVRGVRGALRAGGLASILVAQRFGAVLARAVGGHVTDALKVLTSADGRASDADPLLRRYDETGVRELVTAAGLTIRAIHGVRTFVDLVPGSAADEPAESEALRALEQAAASEAGLRCVAGHLHVLAVAE